MTALMATDSPTERTKKWEHFIHGADIGIRGWGKSRHDAMEHVALALTGVITDPTKIRGTSKMLIVDHLVQDDDALLLYDWLNAIIYRMATEKMVFGKYHLEEHDGALSGWAWGEPIDEKAHDPAVEVKGATMTGLAMAPRETGEWVAECIVDV